MIFCKTISFNVIGPLVKDEDRSGAEFLHGEYLLFNFSTMAKNKTVN